MLAGAAGLGAAWLLLGTIAGSGHDVFGTQSSGVQLVPAVKAAMAKLPPDTPFYSVAQARSHDALLPRPHDDHGREADELGFGVQHGAAEMGADASTSGSSCGTRDRYALALMPPSRYDELRARHVPMQVDRARRTPRDRGKAAAVSLVIRFSGDAAPHDRSAFADEPSILVPHLKTAR